MDALTLTDEILEAFDCNVYDPGLHPFAVYLDRQTGEVIELYDDSDSPFEPEDNEEFDQRVAHAPHRYLKIPGMSIGDQHAIVLGFLNSEEFAEEMEDKIAQEEARKRYLANQSIRDWLPTVDEAVQDAFMAFQEDRIREMVSDFLRENGITAGY
jgi:hypothetical protein